MTTLPLPPSAAALIGLVVLALLIYLALLLIGRDRPAPVWEGLPPGWLALTVVGTLVWIALFLMILAAAFKGLIGAMETPEATSLGLGGLLAALLGAPFLIWSTVLKDRTVRFQKEGHMTDRISKAVEQLGAEKTVKRDGKEWSEPNLEVRIGAILSLERIARDSTDHDRGRDHVRVMEILCAYIRHNAPAKDAKDHPFGDWEPLPDDATAEQRAAREVEREERFGLGISDGQVAEWARSLGPPRADIAEALKVLGRRSRAQMLVEAAWPHPPKPGTAWPFDNAPHLPDEPGAAAITPGELDAFKKRLSDWKQGTRNHTGHRLDLRGTNLQGADLSSGWFQGAKLDGARLEGAYHRGARLEGADLGSARLEGADLWVARLEGADLGEARLEGADLWKARLEGAYQWGARLEGADLREARLEGAYLWEARLEGAYLGQARLEMAYLREARLERAYLWEACLEGAYLGEARLEGAYLWGARLDASTSFQDAELRDVSWKDMDLSMVRLSQDQFNATFGDASVILPEGLTRPAHWPEWTLPDLDPSGRPTFDSELARWRSNPSTYTPPPPP